MPFAERFVFNLENSAALIYNEHLVRYQFVAKFVKGKKVLDIACGSGYGAMILAEAGAKEVVGMDIDKEVVALAKNNYQLDNLQYKEGSAEEIKIEDEGAEVITSLETIEHLPDQEKYLSELKRVLAADGLAFISTPNKQIFKNKNPFHIKELTRSEFENILKKFFPFAVILEQGNGLVSFLKEAGEGDLKNISFTNFSEPLYFLAICSKREISEFDFRGAGAASVNVKALENLQNNPALKISDALYETAEKIPGSEKVLQAIKKIVSPKS